MERKHVNAPSRTLRPLAFLLAAALLPACGSGSSGGAPPSSGSGDLAVPAIQIASPTPEAVYEVNASPVTISGTASDNVGVTSVAWANTSTSASGDATGSESWSASIWLSPGPNTITLTAKDAAGNTATDSITVILRAYSLRGWGKNDRGELGDGTLYTRSRPVTLPYLQGVKQVACGKKHTAVLLTDGTLRVWGDSTVGQVGSQATGAVNPSPTSVTDSDGTLDLKNIVQVDCGEYFTAALDAVGNVWVWGGWDHSFTPPGDPTLYALSAFRIVTSNIRSIAAGANHILMLGTDGTVWAYGNNDFSQLTGATFTGISGPYPIAISGGLRARGVFAGGDSSGAILEDGQAFVWGRNDLAQLGINSQVSPIGTPTLLGTNCNSLAFSKTHGAGIFSYGSARVWGDNSQGQLAGANNPQLTPYPITSSGVGVVVVGDYSTAVLLNDGSVSTLGINTLGTLGTGSAAPNSSILTSVAGLSGVVQIDIGDQFMIALRGDSPVIGVGLDFDGQLGSDRSNAAPIATSPVGISTAAEVYAAGTISLVRLQNGGAVGFGFNFAGEIGDGTFTARALPVDVGGAVPLGGLVQMAGSGNFDIGESFSAARTDTGDILTWGSNKESQLGRGVPGPNSFDSIPDFVNAIGMTPASDLASGDGHILVVGPGGSVWSWGANGGGQLGRPSGVPEVLPAPVPGLTGAVKVSAGSEFSMALLADGTVLAWGDNSLGQLGDGTNISRHVPAPVLGLTGVVAISAGSRHAAALLSNGTVRTWGNNSSGQLGVGTTVSSNVPLQAGFLGGVTAIDCGAEHIVVLMSDGTARAWGYNEFGQVGDSTTTNALFPTNVLGVHDVVQVSAGAIHSMALLSDGSVRGWGGAFFGNLGDGTLIVRTRPVATVGVPSPAGANAFGVSGFAAGGNHSVAVLSLGKVRTWGLNEDGQLGDGTQVSKPRPGTTNIATAVTQVAAGRDHTVLLTNNEGVITMGSNQSGQLGRNTGLATFSATPTSLTGLPAGILKVRAGGESSFLVTRTGALFQFGNDYVGSNVTTPTLVVGFPPATYITDFAAGYGHALALDSAGQVFAWGDDYWGQVGTPTPNVPTQVAGLGNIRSLAAGREHSVAVDAYGAVWTWGSNQYGELGRNTVSIFDTVPAIAYAPGAASNLGAIAAVAGEGYTAILLADGTVRAVGRNETGQLGVGDTADRDTFTTVLDATGIQELAGGRQFILMRK
jgi:alpha-tubulin suppressor-like RCC1 family protein